MSDKREPHGEFISRMLRKPGQRSGDVIRMQAAGFSPVYARVIKSDSPLGIGFEPIAWYRTKRFLRRICGRKTQEQIFDKDIPLPRR